MKRSGHQKDDQRRSADAAAVEESDIFASLQATAVDQGAYEEQVVGGSSSDIVPPILVSPDQWGFPSPILPALIVSQNNGASETVALLEQMLHNLDLLPKTRVRSANPDVMTMKRHILEHALQEAREREKEERKNAPTGTAAIRKQRQQEVVADIAPAVTTVNSKRPRISIMERKQQQVSSPAKKAKVVQPNPMTKEQEAQLHAWREERKRRKEQRRLQWMNDDASLSSDEEKEFVDDSTNIDDETNDKRDATNDSSTDPAPAVSEASSALHVVTCPICNDSLEINSSSEGPDAYLAQHMQTCTGRPSRRRSNGRVTRLSGPAMAPFKALAKAAKLKRTQKSVYKVKLNRNKEPIDDSLLDDYEDRVDAWVQEQNKPTVAATATDKDSILLTPTSETITLPGGLWLPPWIYSRLFPYQRTGVEWMWRLHQEGNGGIVGDEMGLGKTVQVAAFLGAAAASRKLKSVLIVAPGTLLEHWLRELAIWAPGLRRILARSQPPSTALKEWLQHARKERWNEALDDKDWEEQQSWCGTGYCVVTTYEQLRRNVDIYCHQHSWSYVILDEAQHIRNPDADVTMACKQVRTRHRLAMTGTPIQNDLRELWSLVDFCFPGRLGTLPAFEQEFAIPIKRGGYANASPVQVQLAYRCALQVRELVEPFLLRRLKRDIPEVQKMPGKTEQVLFCRLSVQQRDMYEAYLQSDEVLKMMGRRRQSDQNNRHQLLKATTVLRKITNHPDLVCDPNDADQFVQTCGGNVNIKVESDDDDSDLEYDQLHGGESMVARSGKLEVLSKILPLWYKQGHRVLIFCQWRKMLDIIQRFITLKGYKFGRLDGNTNIASRQNLVDTFNNDKSFMGLLCTTRTGGVGLNLTGADRIILYDPDWNPSSDAQARERAWRFGQTRPVTVYRLITAGTIEEKMYHRQIFKTALSNKILQDPRQRRLFSQRDLCDLFTLGSDTGSVRGGGDGVTDTAVATQGIGNVTDETDERVTLSDQSRDDNDMTLKKVMKSQGLAGIFDHDVVEPGSERKNGTDLEIEKHAKQVAKEAVKALMSSVDHHGSQVGVPTWTGSAGAMPQRFGKPFKSVRIADPSSSGSSAVLSSSSLLGSIRKQNASIRTDGINNLTNDDDRNKYALLLRRLQNYVRLQNPTTDEILKEFKEVPESDMSIFRRLLKSVAAIDEHGRWYSSMTTQQE